jgi:hypothetical protein
VHKPGPKSQPSTSDLFDTLSTPWEEIRPRRGRGLVAGSSLHRTVNTTAQSRYRDTLGAYRSSWKAVDPRVSYEIAEGYVPRNSSQVESDAELALAHINRNSGSLLSTGQGAILDKRSSPRGLKGKGRMGLVTPSYASVAAASTLDTITRFEEPSPSRTDPNQDSNASTAAPEQPLSSAMTSLQRFPTEAVRHPLPPNTRMLPYPTSPILGPSLVRGDFQASRRYSEGNASIEPGPGPIPYPYYPGRPLLFDEAGGYASQPVSRDPSVESARSNRSAHSTGQLERSRRRPSLAETEPIPQLPVFTPRIAPTSYQAYERMRELESSARKQTEESNLYSSRGRRNSNSESKDSGFMDNSDYWSNLDTFRRRRNSNSESKDSGFIESSNEWWSNPKTEK